MTTIRIKKRGIYKMVVAALFVLLVFHISFCLINRQFFGLNLQNTAFVYFHGRLGNHMFQYAFLFAISKKFNLTMIVPEDQQLTQTFGVNVQPPQNFGLNYQFIVECLSSIVDQWDCAYDASLMAFEKNREHKYYGYFQSWKYWIEHEQEIRNTFRFIPKVKHEADLVLKNILLEKGIDVKETIVLVGIHVRVADHLDRKNIVFGKRTATKDYLQHAMTYFRRRNRSVLFLACTDDYKWTMDALGEFKDVYVVTGNTPEVDMALLTMTHHTIMTVGTFGWWIGFLTNGTTIYYKHPYVEGSGYSKEFKGDVSEHFYPGWIGMD